MYLDFCIVAASTLIPNGIYRDFRCIYLPFKGIYNEHSTEKHHAASTLISKGIYNLLALVAASTPISKGIYNP